MYFNIQNTLTAFRVVFIQYQTIRGRLISYCNEISQNKKKLIKKNAFQMSEKHVDHFFQT